MPPLAARSITSALTALALLGLCAAATTPTPQRSPAQAKKAQAKARARNAAPGAAPRVTLRALSIVKPDEPGDENEPEPPNFAMLSTGNLGPEGTTVLVRVELPGRTIVGVESKADRLTTLTDDKGTELTEPATRRDVREAPGVRVQVFTGPPIEVSILPGGQAALLTIHGPRTPAPGASRVRLRGQVVLTCGAGEKTVEQKDVAIAKGSKINVGPVPLTLSLDSDFTGFGNDASQTTFTLNSDRPTEAIKKLAFFDAEGREIESQVLGQSSSGFGNRMTYGTLYGLARKLDRVTVRITYYETLEPVTVPLDLTTGVGF